MNNFVAAYLSKVTINKNEILKVNYSSLPFLGNSAPQNGSLYLLKESSHAPGHAQGPWLCLLWVMAKGSLQSGFIHSLQHYIYSVSSGSFICCSRPASNACGPQGRSEMSTSKLHTFWSHSLVSSV